MRKSLLIISSFLCLLIFAPVVSSQEGSKDEKPKARFAASKTKTAKALGQIYSRRIKPLNEKFAKSNDSETKLTEQERQILAKEAFEGFKKLDLAKRKWASHEYAHLYNTLAYFYYQESQDTEKTSTQGAKPTAQQIEAEEVRRKASIKNALKFYIKASEEKDIGRSLYMNIIRTVGQLYIGEEEYQKGINYLEIWRTLTVEEGKEIPSNFLAILARLYYTIENTEQSLVDIELAIDQMETFETFGIAREDWYNLQRANYFNLKNYTKVEKIIKRLIVDFEKPKYWVDLGGIFSDLEREDDIIQAYYIAYMLNALDSHSRLSALGYMYFSAGAPCEGADVIHKGIEAGVINTDIKLYQTVASAYQQCYMTAQAISYLKKAVDIDETGESLARLAGVYAFSGRVEQAIEFGEKALKKGQLRNKAYTVFALVPVYNNRRDFAKARKVLVHLKDDEKYKKQIKNWSLYLNREEEKFNGFKALGIDMDVIYAQTDKLAQDFLELYK